MIRLQDELRNYLKEHVGDQRERQKILWIILESEAIWNDLSE